MATPTLKLKSARGTQRDMFAKYCDNKLEDLTEAEGWQAWRDTLENGLFLLGLDQLEDLPEYDDDVQSLVKCVIVSKLNHELRSVAIAAGSPFDMIQKLGEQLAPSTETRAVQYSEALITSIRWAKDEKFDAFVLRLSEVVRGFSLSFDMGGKMKKPHATFLITAVCRRHPSLWAEVMARYQEDWTKCDGDLCLEKTKTFLSNRMRDLALQDGKKAGGSGPEE